MDFVAQFADFFLHLDTYLDLIITAYGAWTYALLFIIIFCETGLVITPLLPGDSLLFAAGAFAARGSLSAPLLLALLTAAAILGDSVNYFIGSFIGPRAFQKDSARFFKKEYLVRAQNFYEEHGGKIIIIARFLPIIRTFAPFVAGIGKMNYGRFLAYNIGGGALWVALFTLAGFYFGKIPFVKENFSYVILVIIAVSLIPPVIGTLKKHKK